MKRVLAVVSDLHCGSTVGLHPLMDTPLDDGGAYSPSPAQQWLWENWVNFWSRVGAEADGGELHILLNGDLVDGDHHGTTQIVSRHLGTQLDILKACFEPVLALGPKTVTVVRGTEVHVGKSGSAEESFGRWLAAQGVKVTREPGTMNYSHWHFRGMIEDSFGAPIASIDATHHGRIGGRPWSKLGAVGALAAQIVLEHAMRREPAPDFAFRSHYHTHADTGDNYPTRLVQTPAWQLATAYAKRVVPESLSDVGGFMLVFDDDEGDRAEAVLYRPERTPAVRL